MAEQVHRVQGVAMVNSGRRIKRDGYYTKIDRTNLCCRLTSGEILNRIETNPVNGEIDGISLYVDTGRKLLIAVVVLTEAYVANPGISSFRGGMYFAREEAVDLH